MGWWKIFFQAMKAAAKWMLVLLAYQLYKRDCNGGEDRDFDPRKVISLIYLCNNQEANSIGISL